MCSKMSYREAVNAMNHFLHRTEEDLVKVRTVSDRMDSIGQDIQKKLEEETSCSLGMYGFDKETGVTKPTAILSENLVNVQETDPETACKREKIMKKAVEKINSTREEKIPASYLSFPMEKNPGKCVYISIDDIGVKRQKDTRREDSVRQSRFVENSVAHIQYEQSVFMLTAIGMKELFKRILAYLLEKHLFRKELVFFTDGARNIRKSIEDVFAFHPSILILDWYHLKKKCMELLSMSIKGKEERNTVLEKLLRHLWVGNLEEADAYLHSLSDSKIKSRSRLEELCSYLERKGDSIPCYALRAALGLRNSSNPVEKANDLLVAERQKHNGMSWTPHGSGALASIQMLFENNLAKSWFSEKKRSYSVLTGDFCA